MRMPLIVSDEAVAAYQEMVGYYAHRYDGFHGAEYDDLFQEGQLTILIALRNGKLPSKDLMVKQMLKWVNKCAQKGIGYKEPEDEQQ